MERLMYFAFKWKHGDGATVEFEPDGWSSDDPAKTAWLKIESGLSNTWSLFQADPSSPLFKPHHLLEAFALNMIAESQK